MKNELDYIQIEDGLGGNQDWFPEWDMYHGGCAAVTACDLCIYLALREDAASTPMTCATSTGRTSSASPGT